MFKVNINNDESYFDMMHITQIFHNEDDHQYIELCMCTTDLSHPIEYYQQLIHDGNNVSISIENKNGETMIEPITYTRISESGILHDRSFDIDAIILNLVSL